LSMVIAPMGPPWGILVLRLGKRDAGVHMASELQERQLHSPGPTPRRILAWRMRHTRIRHHHGGLLHHVLLVVVVVHGLGRWSAVAVPSSASALDRANLALLFTLPLRFLLLRFLCWSPLSLLSLLSLLLKVVEIVGFHR